MKKQLLIITGPTGVGKTAFVDHLARECSIEIINGDVGQLYTPLTIGTAKPDWRKSITPHHLFDVLSTPTHCTVTSYRRQIKKLVDAIWQRHKLPVIVGGSGFYLLSLFFPPHEQPGSSKDLPEGDDLWEQLYRIDPQRAKEIGPHDPYRLQRALAIWRQTKKKPSEYKPLFDPIADTITVMWLDRDRQDLYQRINERTHQMIAKGWQQEVEALQGTEWESFLREKKLIGYDDFFDYLAGDMSPEMLIATIQKKSRHYAKRQKTFWRSFKRKVEKALFRDIARTLRQITMVELNLTHIEIGGYIKQLKRKICPKEN